MKAFRTLLLLCTFCLDLHVKAAELSIKDCWGKTLPCSVEGRRLVSAGATRLSLTTSALLEQRDAETFQLIRGDFYIETSSRAKFQTPFGQVWCEDECKGLFNREAGKLIVKSLEGKWRIRRLGEAQAYELAPGLQVQLGEVGDGGVAQMEFPQSLPWLPTVKLWSALYPGALSELKPTLVKFRETWKNAVETASVLHAQVASRSVASDAKIRASAAAQKLATEREDQRLRSLFRDKNP